MGIYQDVLDGKKKLTFGIGIGYPQKDRARNQIDDYELAIGAANAHNMTLYKEGRDPVKNHKWRKTKIVDVRTANDKEIDPYGNVHNIPKVPYIKIQSHFPREIKCIEVK
jgi:hypothetical protein